MSGLVDVHTARRGVEDDSFGFPDDDDDDCVVVTLY